MDVKFHKWFGGLFVALVLAATLIAGKAFGAPFEENIGASAPIVHRRAPAAATTVPQTLPSRPVALAARSNRSSEPAPTAAPPSTPQQPRASFPYVIRAGDTLGSISALFGVSIADLMRLNRLNEDTELMVGRPMRIPNPYLARERELTEEIDRLSTEERAASDRTAKADTTIASLRGQINDLTTSNRQYGHNLAMLPWWRGAALTAAAAAALMFGLTLLALLEWWILRSRFRAVAEMNESLRRLDYKYRAALAKAELRMQELYGRRRRGIQDGQDRSKLPEELEIEQLNRQLKEVLERHLRRLGPPGESARRARWRERIAGIGSPIEARSMRR